MIARVNAGYAPTGALCAPAGLLEGNRRAWGFGSAARRSDESLEVGIQRKTDALQSREQTPGGALGIAPVEIVAARILVLDSVPNDVVGDDQDFVRHGHAFDP